MNKNQRIILIVSAAVIIIAVGLAIIFRSEPLKTDESAVERGPVTSLPGAPKFLEGEARAAIGVATDSPIQIFRDESGDNVVYKIIKNEGDVVDDPNAVAPINPSQKLPTAK